MGCDCSTQKWYVRAEKHKDGTALKEISIGHIRDAHEIAGMCVEGYTPVSLVPESSVCTCCCCPCCCVSIPHGFSALVTSFGKHVPGDEPDGAWSPGRHCWKPWHRVTRLVTRQIIVFDTPVKFCKTKDDITIDIEVLISLEITNAQDFAYFLGPEKLDDFLRATQEEVLRNMVGAIPVDHIHDLHGKNTAEWVEAMNKTFKQYGIVIRDFTIKNVKLPNDMAADYEADTLFQSKTAEKKMMQEKEMQKLNHEEARDKLRTKCLYQTQAKMEDMETAKARLSSEVASIAANSAKTLAVKETERRGAVQAIETTAMLEFAQIKAETMQIERDIGCKLETDVGKLEAEASFYERKQRAQAKMEASEKIAEGTKAIAEAEGEAIAAFAARRLQEQEMARLKILEALADNKQIKIATSLENSIGLAPDNSLVAQVAQQGLEAFRMKLAEITGNSAGKLDMNKKYAGGLFRPVPTQEQMR